MNVFKSELEARERSLAIGGKEQSIAPNNYFSTQSLQLSTSKERDRNRNHASNNFMRKTAGNFSSGRNKFDNNRVVICVFCKEKHLSSRCKNVTSINVRFGIVKRENRCFICLQEGHRSQYCRLNYICLKCGKKHNIALCQESADVNKKSSKETLASIVHTENVQQSQLSTNGPNDASHNEHTTVLVGNTSGSSHDEIVLQSAMADVSDARETRTSRACVLFDGGSQRTYLTDRLRERLGLRCIRRENLILKRFAQNEGKARCLDVVQICLKGRNGTNVYLEALCVPYICSPMKAPVVNCKLEYLRDVELAAQPTDVNNVEILVGLDFYFSVMSGRTLRGPPGYPVAVESVLGWILCGRSSVSSGRNEVLTNLMHAEEVEEEVVEDVDLKEELKKFWEVESIYGDVNDIVHEEFVENIQFNGKRYVTSLPFKNNIDFVPDNYQISYKRLLVLLKKLERNPELKKEYTKIIEEYEKEEIIEVVDVGPDVPGKVHYLPHRAVVRNERTSSKVRIVFDGSAKERGGKSINELLYAGPCMLSNIFDIMIRFCLGRFAIVADIRQAFLNIEICDKDKDFLRFLFPDSTDESKVKVYRFTRACFGITSSPFLLNATIQYHMNQLKDKEPNLASKFIRDIYVDDLTSNVDSIEEGVRFHEFAKQSMYDAGFDLRKWYSNSDELRKLMHCSEDDVSRKVLGVSWNEKDEFVFDFRELVEEALKLTVTKRNILRFGAKFYDPIVSYIITSKTKVTPIKKLTIPRLELLSCLLLTELMSKLCDVLKDVIDVNRIYLWSDSEVALSWIRGEGKEWKPWIKNRICKIRQMSNIDDWRYVSTTLNPADIATRESSVVNFPGKSLWWVGPSFLREEDMLDIYNVAETTDAIDEGDLAMVLVVDSVEVKVGVGNVVNFENYSSLIKLLRVIAYIRRFVYNCLHVKEEKRGEIYVEETEDALKLCVKWEQTILVDKGFKNLKKQLSLHFDADGVIRLRGRLEYSHLSYESKHPILLNRTSYFTRLVILDAHLRVKHMRLKATLNEVRSNYWICKGKQMVKSVLKDCVKCKEANAKTIIGPPPPDLPEYRVAYEFAYVNVGVDYAGPLFVRDVYDVSLKMHKAYILLFTCAATRGVHLELCPDMSTPCLIRGLKRFISRRGKCNLVISDNFQTFVSKDLKMFLTIVGIKWSHILSKSPWWGAFYERLIRIIKDALKKVVGKARLTYEEMETILDEIEMIVNCRPLTYLYEEADDEALTPSHLVIGRRLLNSSTKGDVNFDEQTAELLNSRYKYFRNIIDHYWKRFSKEYLAELHQHHMYAHKGNYDEFCKLLLGDVVLIKEDSMKRNMWKKGRVERLIYGKDGEVRGALLKVCNGGKVSYIERPLQKIVPLEVQKDDDSDKRKGDDSDTRKDDTNIRKNGDPEVRRDHPEVERGDKGVMKDGNIHKDSASSSKSKADASSKHPNLSKVDGSRRKRIPPDRFQAGW